MTQIKAKIYIIHENDEWLIPLRIALEKLDVDYEEWSLDTMVVNIDDTPPNGVFFSRMSASNYTRNHLHSNQSTSIILRWLETHNRRVINGSSVLNLEFSKAFQQLELKKYGFMTPKTIVAVGTNKIMEAAIKLNIWPMIIKPNQGGKGLGIKLINTINELDNLIKQNLIVFTLDDTWLLQEKIPTDDDFITRMEFVGGSFMYSLKVYNKGSFELCPADVCEINYDESHPVDEGNNIDLDNQPTFFIEENPDIKLANKIEGFLKDNNIEVAGVEFIKNNDDEPVIYDINTNTNYNLNAEKHSSNHKNGMEEIASFLKAEFKKYNTNMTLR
jgi:hypothetical protein